MIDNNGIEYAIYNKNSYYNCNNAAKYVGMTEIDFRQKVKKIERERGIIFPLMRLLSSQQSVYYDKRLLDVFRQLIYGGEEAKWIKNLIKVIQEIDTEIE